MFDLMVAELKQDLIEKINASGLPMTITAYILKDLLDMANSSAQAEINQQRAEKQKREEEIAKQAAATSEEIPVIPAV